MYYEFPKSWKKRDVYSSDYPGKENQLRDKVLLTSFCRSSSREAKSISLLLTLPQGIQPHIRAFNSVGVESLAFQPSPQETRGRHRMNDRLLGGSRRSVAFFGASVDTLRRV